MTEQDLDDPDAQCRSPERVRGKAMPKRVGRHTLAEFRLARCLAARQAD